MCFINKMVDLYINLRSILCGKSEGYFFSSYKEKDVLLTNLCFTLLCL